MKGQDKYPRCFLRYKSFDEDFDGGNLKPKRIGKDYQYINDKPSHKILSFLLYRFIAAPLAYLHSKLITRDRIIGKEKLREYENEAVFLFGNHTHAVGDAFLPNLLYYPKRTSIIVSPKNLSLPILGGMLGYLGGIPTPDDLPSAKNFSRAISALVERKQKIAIYPEARLWPYCGFLRPFSESSFEYPVKYGAPAFAFTRVYRRNGRGVGSDIYIDGPFFADEALPKKEAREKLAREIENKMKERLLLSDILVIDYEQAKAE